MLSRRSNLAVAIGVASIVPLLLHAQPQPDDRSLGRRIGLPDWFDLGGEIRGRGEGFTGQNFVAGADDGYYLNRVRLHLGIRATNWLRVFAEAQDSRAPGYDFGPVPATMAEPLGLRQAYVALGDAENGWALRVGRQELIFGEERLVGAANWGNVGRTFDAVRLIFNRPGLRMDAFASAVVTPTDSAFDRPHFNNKLYGIYVSKTRLPRKTVVQPYIFLRTGATARAETGTRGDLDEYTLGVRALSQLSIRIDADTEMAYQVGNMASDTIRAWAGHWRMYYRVGNGAASPRVVLEYNYASGDSRAGDGRRGTFDQLYPTNHNKYGIADRIGWRNIHDLMGGIDWAPRPAWKINVDYHSFWLAEVGDALYTESGVPFVRNASATSAHVGTELDFQALYKFSAQLQFGAGYGRLFPGEYLKETVAAPAVSSWYVFATYGF